MLFPAALYARTIWRRQYLKMQALFEKDWAVCFLCIINGAYESNEF